MSNFNHVMLDLETLSTRSDACIIQIAAVAFDIETGETGPRFNAYVNESCLVGAKVGHIDVSTVGFWMRQKFGPSLGEAITDEDEQRSLAEALGEFDQWLANLAENAREDDAPVFEGMAADVEDLSLWSHGAGFDIPILASAYDRAELGEVPWHYRAPRDTRTLFALAPGGMPRPPKDETREHDAQYDCEYQVAQVCEAYAALRDLRVAKDAWKKRALALGFAANVETHDDPPVEGGYTGLPRNIAEQEASALCPQCDLPAEQCPAFAQTVVAGQQ
jgi:hypothetical protein